MTEDIITKPLLALRGMMVFPGMTINLDVGREKSIHAIDLAEADDHKLFLTTQKEAAITDITIDDLYSFGTLVEIKQRIQLPNGAIRVLVEGISRVKYWSITESSGDKASFMGHGELVKDIVDTDDTEVEALRRMLLDVFDQWAVLTQKVSPELAQSLQEVDPCKLTDTISGYLTVKIEEKQQLLEIVSVKERMHKLYSLLAKELEIATMEKNISLEVRKQIEKNQKDYYLREQIKAMYKELGDADEPKAEANAYRAKFKALQLPEDIADKMEKEIVRLEKMPPMTAEGGVIRNYLDAVLDLPWGKFTQDNYDLKHAAEILDRDHYGLKKVKERILEYLAVRALTKTMKGPILCFVGPPGVGKTSLARSIADAIGRSFTRISLGGVHDEAEIRGHRRTYLGSMPGRIIHGMQNCGCMNPVFLLDEVDKMTSDFRGDPASALLEALDPEQNNTFSDHFIEFPFDLSNVFWIVTANTVETIPAALLDRMEIISLTSYTEEEKTKIAELHLLPKEIKEHGLTDYKVSISTEAMHRIIREYTREAGVRNLERKIAGVCRKVARNIVVGKSKGAKVIASNVEKFLGKPIFMEEDITLGAEIGTCTGLAWTSVGGELLKVEVLTYKGKGALTLTGQLGDVMKESAQAGFTYIRSRSAELGLPDKFYETEDLHIHLPEGAIPKDGPSAGITMVTAMVSALTKRKVKANLAMTGEITLSGKVLPVGGIKEKVLAAHRYGVKTVLLPQRNMVDLDEIPDNIRRQMEFIPVKHMDEVLKLALED